MIAGFVSLAPAEDDLREPDMQLETKTFCATALLTLLMGAATLLQAHFMAVSGGSPAGIAAQISPRGDDLIIPVAGVAPGQLVDTWGAARSAGRRHEGIDIMAPQGSPVRATTAGVVLKFANSPRGGVTIYQMDPSKRYIFYYAHLKAREARLPEGGVVSQGQVIGYVGSTGDATVSHLHFEIQRAAAQGQWWRGKAVDPYPFLIAGSLRRPD